MKYGLSAFTDTYLTSFGLIIFFGFFVATIWWVTRERNKDLYKRIEQLPFLDGGSHE